LTVRDVNIERLLRLLPEASALLDELGESQWSARCLRATESARDGRLDFVPELWNFFAPTCEWDDLTASCPDPAVRVGSEVFQSLNLLAERHELKAR